MMKAQSVNASVGTHKGKKEGNALELASIKVNQAKNRVKPVAKHF